MQNLVVITIPVCFPQQLGERGASIKHICGIVGGEGEILLQYL